MLNNIPRERFSLLARDIRQRGLQGVMTPFIQTEWATILAALDQMATCCHAANPPGPWKAGVDDAADPKMIRLMTDIASKISYRTPLSEHVKFCKWTVSSVDTRTRMGDSITRCLLANSAAFIQVLMFHVNPWPWQSWRERVRDAWYVYKRKAVAIYVTRTVYDKDVP